MLTRKPCKYCGSLWHSKARCAQKPAHAFKNKERTETPLLHKNALESLRTRQNGISERQQLTNRADKLFSPYIRMRNMTWYLTNYCFTCGVELPWGELQNGHFMPRRYVNTRWDEINCNPQCNDCNVVKGGNLEVYEKKLRTKHGDAIIDELIQRARSGNKFTTEQIREIVDKYS